MSYEENLNLSLTFPATRNASSYCFSASFIALRDNDVSLLTSPCPKFFLRFSLISYSYTDRTVRVLDTQVPQ
jgi:hypothetical protein